MVRYEFVFLIRSGLAKKKLNEIFAELEEQIKKTGGKISKKEDLGKKDLSYPISKEKTANFFAWHLDFEEAVNFSPLYTFLNRNEFIIRFLILKGR